MKLFNNYNFFLVIFFLLIILCGIGYYFLNNSEKDLAKIHHLYFENLDLETTNLTRNFEQFEIIYLKKAYNKLVIADENKKKIKMIVENPESQKDSLGFNLFAYNNCVNQLHHTSKYEVSELKGKLSKIKLNIENLKQENLTEKGLEEKRVLYKEEFEKIYLSTEKTKQKLNELCFEFDSLNFILNSYIQ